MELTEKLLSSQEHEELNLALQKMADGKNIELYKLYPNIFMEYFLISSEEDAIDLLDNTDAEMVEMNKSIFSLGFLGNKKKCLSIGGFEINVEEKLFPFVILKTKNKNILDDFTPSKNIFTDIDGKDNFFDFISKLNKKIRDLKMEIVLFYDDIYYQCAFHLFICDKNLANDIFNNWNDKYIKIMKY